MNSKFVTTVVTPTRPWYEIVGLVGVSVWSWVPCGWQELVLAKNLSVMQENLFSKKAQEGHKINQGSTLVVSDTASAKYLGFIRLFFCNLDFEACDSGFGVLPHPFACLTE